MAIHLLKRDSLDALFKALEARGYTVVGPTVREGAIVYDRISEAADLPAGWTDEQEAGRYRLHRRDDEACFGYAVGPHSWKRFLHPPRLRLWSAERREDGFEIVSDGDEPEALAFLGVRPCEIAAMRVQDRVFLEGAFQDPDYRRRRGRAFVIAVRCTQPAGTCFCTSMGTGPGVEEGFDLALTELAADGDHAFTVEAGSAAGEEIRKQLPLRPASAEEVARARREVSDAAGRMGRELDTHGIEALLAGSYEHPAWEAVGDRCLSCGNCTMACPTCFCTTVEDVTDLVGDRAERIRRWDSCFTLDFSYLHGGSVRSSTTARYRQWLTHKLGTWIEQFGTSGCVGCGRCITWCPVGIDLTRTIPELRLEPEADTGEREGRGAD